MGRFASKFVKKRFEGTRWALLYGAYEGAERFALAEAQRFAQTFVPYVMPTLPAADSASVRDHHALLVGTPERHPMIRELVRAGRIDIPPQAGGYALAALPDPATGDRRPEMACRRGA